MKDEKIDLQRLRELAIRRKTFKELLVLADECSGDIAVLGAKKNKIIDKYLLVENDGDGCEYTMETNAADIFEAAEKLRQEGYTVVGLAQLQGSYCAENMDGEGIDEEYGMEHIYQEKIPILLAYTNGRHRAVIRMNESHDSFKSLRLRIIT